MSTRRLRSTTIQESDGPEHASVAVDEASTAQPDLPPSIPAAVKKHQKKRKQKDDPPGGNTKKAKPQVSV